MIRNRDRLKYMIENNIVTTALLFRLKQAVYPERLSMTIKKEQSKKLGFLMIVLLNKCK